MTAIAQAVRSAVGWWTVRSDERLSPIHVALLFFAPLTLAALFFVWTHITTIRLGYTLSRVGEEHHGLLEENRGLRIEVASLKAPDRLKRLAESHYRLAPPRSEQVVRVEDRR